MKKLILLVIIFSFLFSTTSWGEWELGSYGTSPPSKNFYDKDRVRKSGKYLYIWQLIDFAKPLESGVLSTTMYTQLDCSIFRIKSLKVQFYKKSMGEGEMIGEITPKGENGEWKYPHPNSAAEILYNKVCEEHQ